MADVVVAGAAGRMGNRLVALLQEDKELRLVAALEAPGHPALGRDAGEAAGVGRLAVPITADADAALGQDRILIEFSVPEASLAHARLAARQGGRAVIGTTGFTPAQREELAAIGRSIAILVAPNMSVGVNVVMRLIEQAAKAFSHGYDIEIIEAHHRNKIDAPSGTALKMGEVVAGALGRNLADNAVFGREGVTGARDPSTIGFATVRGGDIIGDHTVLFAGIGERIEITHKSSSRATYAQGSLRAARFLARSGPGLYDMNDVLGLN